MELALLLLLVLLNGAFAMAEIALVSARRSRLAALAEGGNRGAERALALVADPTRFLSTVQIGITSIGLLNGIVGEAVLARPFAAWLRTFGVEATASEVAATAVVVLGVTYVSIVVGELVPKRIGQLAPERIACLVAGPMRFLAGVTRPFVHLLAASTAVVLRALGQREVAGSGLTMAEIHEVLVEGSAAGVIDQDEHLLTRNVLRLDQRPLGSLMVPRGEVTGIDLARPAEENLRRIADAGHAHYPAFAGSPDRPLGIVRAADLLEGLLRGDLPDLGAMVRPAAFVPESMDGMALLRHFRATGAPMAFVMDEFGEFQGIVTLHDVIASVFGPAGPPEGPEAWAVRREDGSLLLDGLLPFAALGDVLGVDAAAIDPRGGFHTVAGLMMWLLGRLPRTGDAAEWHGWRLEVVDLDGRRIDKVLATPPASEAR